MIRTCHDHHRLESVLVAPTGKYLSFIFAAHDVGRDSLGIPDAERAELANQHVGAVLVRETTARELARHRIWRIAEHCDSRGDARPHHIRGFESTLTADTNRQDDDVGRLRPFSDDQDPPGRPKSG